MSDIAQEQALAALPGSALCRGRLRRAFPDRRRRAPGAARSLDMRLEAATLIRIDITGALRGRLRNRALGGHVSALRRPAHRRNPDCSRSQRRYRARPPPNLCSRSAAMPPTAYAAPLARWNSSLSSPSVIRRAARASSFLSPATLFLLKDALDFELHIVRLAAPRRSRQSQPCGATGSSLHRLRAAASLCVAWNQSNNRNLDLLLDIELGVTLRFGSRQMLLKDILELCSGSVVELDRRVEEPVDLLIDGRLIAQGEVVIVGGNYGLRIPQVATQSEKIACLP